MGETGTGKTTACQMAAFMRGQRLHIINCNQHTETADFIGGYRPNRHRERAYAEFNAALARFNSAAEGHQLQQAEMAGTDIEDMFTAAQTAQVIASGVNATDPLHALAGLLKIWAGKARAPFEWVDGPLVEAMRHGDVLLIDEVNLAEDAVLERLNR